MLTLDMPTLFGLSCVVLAVSLIAFSRYRYWLVFMFAGMVFGSALELLRLTIQSITDIATLYAYISASLFMCIGLVAFLIFYGARYHTKNKANCIEHTPVYDNKQSPNLS